MTLRVAVDVGGTFTDGAVIDTDTGRIVTAKTPSTPHQFVEGVLQAVTELRHGQDASPDEFTFASTIFINALVTGQMARTALLTTFGFRDVLEIGRGNRPDMYNLLYEKPSPFIPRELRFEIHERMDYRGEIVAPPHAREVAAVARELRDLRVESVAISFLHSYANDAHELMCKDILQTTLGPDVPVVASSEVARLWLEYERTVSTAANAGLAPLAVGVFAELDAALDGAVRIRRAMRSNGGVSSFARASRSPIHLVESGPAGGVIGTRAVGERVGITDLISFDVGGTTAKCALISRGRLPYTLDYVLRPHDSYSAGYPLRTPTIDIVEIGAGGGSIAFVDEGGRLSVGPQSAGAVPGPIAYGLGGQHLTLTDVCLLAGYIGAETFVGSGNGPAIDAAEAALVRLAQQMRVGRDEALLGVVELAQIKMANVVKLVSVKRGYDPREHTLVAFGGGGPLHASAVAQQLGMTRAIVPRFPSVFSAVGMLAAELREDAVATWVARISPEMIQALASRLEALTESAAGRLIQLGAAGDAIVAERSLEMRYLGQEHSVAVPLPPALPDHVELVRLFEEEHQRAYQFVTSDPVEVVHLRVITHAPRNGPEAFGTHQSSVDPEAAVESSRSLLTKDGWIVAPTYDRRSISQATAAHGPAIISDDGTSTVLLPGWTARALPSGDLMLTLE